MPPPATTSDETTVVTTLPDATPRLEVEAPREPPAPLQFDNADASTDEMRKKKAASSAKGTAPSLPGAFQAGGAVATAAARPEVGAPQEPQSAYERKTGALRTGGAAAGSAAAARTSEIAKESLQRKLGRGQRSQKQPIGASRTSTDSFDDRLRRKSQFSRDRTMAASAVATAARTSITQNVSLQRKIDQGQRNRESITASKNYTTPEAGWAGIGEEDGADHGVAETQTDVSVSSSRAVHVQSHEQVRTDNFVDNGPTSPSAVTEEKTALGGRKIKLYLGLALALVVVIVAVVVPAVVLTKDDNGGNVAESETTTEPDNSIYRALLNISREEDLTGETTPQYQALDWILHKDTLGLNDASSNLSQRYSLMVLFFATDGANWIASEEQYGNVLQHECNWTLVECTMDLSIGAGVSGRKDLSSNEVVTGLKLQDLRLKGRLPLEFRELVYLEHLDLSQNSLSGSFPSEIYELTNLRTLDLGRNNFDSSLDERIGGLNKLQELSLKENGFGGVLPVAFQNLTDMRKVNLTINSFSGPLFDMMLPMLHIDTFSASDNFFSGTTIPSGIGKLSKLRSLDCFSCYLEGNIPDEFGQLESLVECVLGGNQLDGKIPPSLGDLSTLEYLSLEGNYLSGSIIPELGKLTNLESLHLHSNDLTGSIPAELCSLRSGNLTDLIVDCDIVHGGCCSECKGTVNYVGQSLDSCAE